MWKFFSLLLWFSNLLIYSSELSCNDLSRLNLSASKNDVLVVINWSPFC